MLYSIVMKDKLLIQKILGDAFIIAGIGKFFKFIEDLFKTLAFGHAANINSFFETYSNWVIANEVKR